MTGRHHHTHRIPTDQLRDATDARAARAGGSTGTARASTSSWPVTTAGCCAWSAGSPTASTTPKRSCRTRGWMSSAARRASGATARCGGGWPRSCAAASATTWRARDARPQVLTEFLPEDVDQRRGAREPGGAARASWRGCWPGCPRISGRRSGGSTSSGLPVDEVAARLGVAAGTVKSRCHRGRARLRLKLKGPEAPAGLAGSFEALGPAALSVRPIDASTHRPKPAPGRSAHSPSSLRCRSASSQDHSDVVVRRKRVDVRSSCVPD